MRRTVIAGLQKLKARVASRDRDELWLLLGMLALLGGILVIVNLAGEVIEGNTLEVDKRMLAGLRKADNPSQPIGPPWLELAAFDITALGGPTVLGMTVLAVVGFLVLHGMYRNAASCFSPAWAAGCSMTSSRSSSRARGPRWSRICAR
ncbi:hypothetical protein BH24ACI5_BH24ACI5_12240 [soil metagenome]